MQMIKFFIKMSLLFILFDVFTRYMPAIFTNYIFNFKYGKHVVAEGVFALLVLSLIIIFKNTYIFYEKKEPFGKSIFLGLPMLIFAGISLTTTNIYNVPNGVFVNLVLFCTLVGIAEEFLCRGWIQNEFIEQFSSNYKEAFLSVFLSSLIFGTMHISNIGTGQTVFETLMQIIQATSLGFLLGSVYFRTKNIWAVVFLHAFYDFAFLLPEANTLKECTTNEILTFSQTVQSVYESILISALFFTCGLIVFRKNKIMPLINKKDKKAYKDRKKNLLYITGIIVLLMYIPLGSGESIKTCYKYEKMHVSDYETIYSHKKVYNLVMKKNNVDYNFTLYGNMNKLIFRNNNTNYEVVLHDYIVEKYDKFLLIQNENDFKILIFKNDDDSTIYYEKINFDTLGNENLFLDGLKNRLKEYTLPDLKDIGSIKISNNEELLAFMIDELNNKFYINDYGKLYHISN